mmetsp:Transcript_105606/g.251742  ORF Transcript_105606/g.251742 Transcript_105606/m.251742 type:complete len:326 (-) Transcript_105606:3000-3977(-)
MLLRHCPIEELLHQQAPVELRVLLAGISDNVIPVDDEPIVHLELLEAAVEHVSLRPAGLCHVEVLPGQGFAGWKAVALTYHLAPAEDLHHPILRHGAEVRAGLPQLQDPGRNDPIRLPKPVDLEDQGVESPLVRDGDVVMRWPIAEVDDRAPVVERIPPRCKEDADARVEPASEGLPQVIVARQVPGACKVTGDQFDHRGLRAPDARLGGFRLAVRLRVILRGFALSSTDGRLLDHARSFLNGRHFPEPGGVPGLVVGIQPAQEHIDPFKSIGGGEDLLLQSSVFFFHVIQEAKPLPHGLLIPWLRFFGHEASVELLRVLLHLRV